MRTINTINSILYIALTVLYFYQFIYIVIALIGDKKTAELSCGVNRCDCCGR